MKKFFFLFFLTLLYAYAQDTEAILEKLAHFQTDKKLLHVKYSPFKVDALKTTILSSTNSVNSTPTTQWILKAILNKKAFINNAWYGVGETVGEYKLKNIYDNGIVLENGKITKTLKLDVSKMYLKVKDK